MPHDVLSREAAAIGYPLWLLRLSIATYRLTRVLRVGKVFANTVVAWRGITAGSGFATTEMRVTLIILLDAKLLKYPMGVATLFVDDISTEMTVPDDHIADKTWQIHLGSG